MTDRPILFSGPMVRALLDGRKTQTRRVIKPQPKLAPHHEPVRVEQRSDRGWVWMVCTDRPAYQFATGDWRAPYAIGDRLYVREAWRADGQIDAVSPRDMSEGEPVLYEVDGVVRSTGCAMIEPGRFRQGMHMPRWASRLTLAVTDVRVQRLRDIREDDAAAEGVEADSDGWRDYQMPATQCCGNPRDSFRSLWDSLNAARGYGWDENPWVVAISFDVHRQNIDSMGAAA